jgi:CubicO group peptidase (beta-lactamase class C family)
MKKEVKNQIQELMDEAIRQGITAGISMLVCRKGEEIFYTDRGYQNLETKKKIRRDTIFRLYSMSKPITASAVMLLMEQGKLDLAQPVEEILPGFALGMAEGNGRMMPVNKPVTILHLLNMTSGLTYGDPDTLSGKLLGEYLKECESRMFTDHPVSTVEFADHAGTLPLAFEPGSSWRYGISADVLGAVVEKVSGMRFGEFLHTYLFEPLGMKDTGFWVPEEKRERLADAYETTGEGSMIPYRGNHLVISYTMDKPPAFESGGAGLVSTIDDYEKFGRMLLQGGRLGDTRILSKKTVEFLTSGTLTPSQQKSMDEWSGLEGHTYSHLMRRVVEPGNACGLTIKGEYGWDGWLGCYFANFPSEDMTMLIMQQKKDSGTISLTRKIRNLVLSNM